MNLELEPHQRVDEWKQAAIVEVFPSDKLVNELPLIEQLERPITVSVPIDYPWEEMQSKLLIFPVTTSLEVHVKTRTQESKQVLFKAIDWVIKKKLNMFLIAGDDLKHGPYAGVPEALDDIQSNNVALPQTAFAAYPHAEHKRAHGIIPNETLNRALSYKQDVVKNGHAVTQMHWDPQVIADWIVRERIRGITIPFYVNVFPPLSYRLIASYIKRIGLVNAKHIIATFPDPIKFAVEFAKGYSPDKLLLDLARLRADVAGIVVTSTNRFERVREWLDTPTKP